MGEAWAGWAREAGKGGRWALAGDGGGRRGGVGARGEMGESSVGATKGALVGFLKNVTIGLIWLTKGRVGWGGGGPGRRARGGDGRGGHQRAVWEQQGMHWFHVLGSLKNRRIGLIWLVTRGGGGGVGGGGPGRRARRWAGGTGSIFWAPLKNLTIGLIWLVRAGGGEAWGGVGQGGGQGGEMGGGHREAAKGGRWAGGAPESSVGGTRGALVPPFCGLLTIGLIWLVTRGGVGGGVRGVGQGGGQGGEMGRGAPGSTFLAPLKT